MTPGLLFDIAKELEKSSRRREEEVRHQEETATKEIATSTTCDNPSQLALYREQNDLYDLRLQARHSYEFRGRLSVFF